MRWWASVSGFVAGQDKTRDASGHGARSSREINTAESSHSGERERERRDWKKGREGGRKKEGVRLH